MHDRKNLRLGAAAAALCLVAAIGFGCSDESNTAQSKERLADPSTTAEPEDADDLEGAVEGRGSLPFADTEVFFEFNSTDNDLGFQLFLDGVGWQRVSVWGPDRDRVIDFKAKGPLRELGLTELRFESAEPSPAEVLALFAPGRYRFGGISTNGERMFGEGELSHDLPPAPVFTHPLDGASVDAEDLVIEWVPIGGLAAYEVIVANDDSGASMTVELDGKASSMHVPNEFMEEATQYKAEILSIAENGNKTITEVAFATN